MNTLVICQGIHFLDSFHYTHLNCLLLVYGCIVLHQPSGSAGSRFLWIIQTFSIKQTLQPICALYWSYISNGNRQCILSIPPIYQYLHLSHCTTYAIYTRIANRLRNSGEYVLVSYADRIGSHIFSHRAIISTRGRYISFSRHRHLFAFFYFFHLIHYEKACDESNSV